MNSSLLLEYQPRALARLAQSTAVVVATLLTIPDAIALMPGSETPTGWLLKVIGIWIIALVLWYVSFLGLLYLIRFIAGGVGLNESGVRLWRWGKLIPWDCLEAVEVEPQQRFARLFCLPDVQRLTLYVRRKAGGKIAPQVVPSYLFAPEDFAALIQAICGRAFAIEPDQANVLISRQVDQSELSKLARVMRWQRLVLTVIIAFSLCLYLGRKTIVNYKYALANKEFKAGNYAQAAQGFRYVLMLDPAFAVGWHNLAGAEFQLGQVDEAREHWQRALFLKPDLVDAKVSLSFLYMKARQFNKANELLESGLRFAPRNSGVLVNMADLNLRVGNPNKALHYAHLVLSEQPNNELAICLVARARLQMGKAQDAWQWLSAHRKPNANPFCKLVAGEIQLKLGHLREAEQLFREVLKVDPKNADALQYLQTVEQLQQTRRLRPGNFSS